MFPRNYCLTIMSYLNALGFHPEYTFLRESAKMQLSWGFKSLTFQKTICFEGHLWLIFEGVLRLPEKHGWTDDLS